MSLISVTISIDELKNGDDLINNYKTSYNIYKKLINFLSSIPAFILIASTFLNKGIIPNNKMCNNIISFVMIELTLLFICTVLTMIYSMYSQKIMLKHYKNIIIYCIKYMIVCVLILLVEYFFVYKVLKINDYKNLIINASLSVSVLNFIILAILFIMKIKKEAIPK